MILIVCQSDSAPSSILVRLNPHAPQTNHMAKKAAKYKKFDVSLSSGQQLTLYSGDKVLRALEGVTTDMTIYQGVKLGQVMKAVYEQGQKDGRREAIEALETSTATIKKSLKYQNPGRPKKS